MCLNIKKIKRYKSDAQKDVIKLKSENYNQKFKNISLVYYGKRMLSFNTI